MGEAKFRGEAGLDSEGGRGRVIYAFRLVLSRAFGVVSSRENLYIAPALLYSVGLLLYYLVYGVALDYIPALFFVGVFSAMTIVNSSRKLDKYWISIISIMVSYESLQGAVGTMAASRGIASLYSLDRLIWGFNLTGWVQSTFDSPAVTFITSVFYSLHIPLVAATCLILWYVKRPLFGKYITVMVLTSYAALVTFIIVPTSPPWYAGAAANLYQSAVASDLPHSFSYLLSLVEVDQFAAFPSLHAAYAIIFSYFMIKVNKRLALVSIPITSAILFSTIYLGQHYLIDLIAGAIYVLIPCLIAERFQLRIANKSSEAEPSSLTSTVVMRATPQTSLMESASLDALSDLSEQPANKEQQDPRREERGSALQRLDG